MENFAGLVTVVLVAILVGAILPVLYQAVQTLKSVRAFVDNTGPRINEAMTEVTRAATRLNAIASALEEEGRRFKPVVETAAGIGQMVSSLGESVRSAGSVFGAVAPALIAALRAFFGRADDDEDDEAADAPTGAPEGEEGGRRAPPTPAPEGGVRRGL
jgi:uncharacterized protein YoxC